MTFTRTAMLWMIVAMLFLMMLNMLVMVGFRNIYCRCHCGCGCCCCCCRICVRPFHLDGYRTTDFILLILPVRKRANIAKHLHVIQISHGALISRALKLSRPDAIRPIACDREQLSQALSWSNILLIVIFIIIGCISISCW